MTHHYFTDFFIAFLSLIAISAVFSVYRKLTDSKNVFVHALCFVPITCCVMTIACVPLWIILIALLEGLAQVFRISNTGTPFSFLIITILLIVPLLVFIAGVFVLKRFARRNLKKHIYTAYAIVFIASGIFGACLSVKGIFFPPWVKTQVENHFSYETQRMPNLSNEHNARLRFNSGKIVNLIKFIYDKNNYTLYQLNNGDIFMQEEDKYQDNYIVSPAEEEVYYYDGEYKYKLNGKAIYSWHSHGSAKIDLPEGTMFFNTYENYSHNKPSRFKVEGTKLELPSDLPRLGELTRQNFNKTIQNTNHSE